MKTGDKSRARLPRWARVELERLERNLEYADQRIQELTGKTKTRIMLTHPGGYAERTPLYLNESGRVYFVMGEHSHIAVSLSDDGRVSIQGTDEISVMPRASNSVEVKIK